MPQMKSRATNKSEMQNAAAVAELNAALAPYTEEQRAVSKEDIDCGETANDNVPAIAVMNESTSGYSTIGSNIEPSECRYCRKISAMMP